jgi:hypothetical protein
MTTTTDKELRAAFRVVWQAILCVLAVLCWTMIFMSGCSQPIFAGG